MNQAYLQVSGDEVCANTAVILW